MSKKKLTMKEAEERINILSYNLNVTKTALDSVASVVNAFIMFTGKGEEFKKHLENIKNVDKLKEDAKNDTK